jgi:hypothetical protein
MMNKYMNLLIKPSIQTFDDKVCGTGFRAHGAEATLGKRSSAQPTRSKYHSGPVERINLLQIRGVRFKHGVMIF